MNIGSRPHLGTDTARHSPGNASAGGDRCLRWGADNKVLLGFFFLKFRFFITGGVHVADVLAVA